MSSHALRQLLGALSGFGRALFKRLSLALLATVALLVAFIEIASEMLEGETLGVDRRLSLWVHGFEGPALDVVMESATALGEVWVMALLVALLAAWTAYKERVKLAVTLALVTCSCGALNTTLKLLFQRARPTLFEKITAPQSYSFPSGHAMGSIVVYAMIAFVLSRLYPALKWPVYALAAVLIALIGLSRIYLGVHWPSDVLGGFLAGGALLATTALIVRRAPEVTKTSPRHHFDA